MPSNVYRFGVLMEHVHWDCMDQWRSKYCPHERLSDLMAGVVTQIEENVTHYPGGRVHVVCTVSGKRTCWTESYFFVAQRIAPAEYVVKSSSFTL